MQLLALGTQGWFGLEDFDEFSYMVNLGNCGMCCSLLQLYLTGDMAY